MYVQGEYEQYSRQNQFYAADDTETATAGYGLVNAGIGFSINDKRENSLVKVYINASNLFNKAYQSNLNRLKYFEYYNQSPTGKYGIYNMGRNVSIKATMSL